MTLQVRMINLEPLFEQYEQGRLDLSSTCSAIAQILHDNKLDYFALAFLRAGESGDPIRADQVLDELLQFGERSGISFSNEMSAS